MMMRKNLILTGAPSVGKTTVIQRAMDRLQQLMELSPDSVMGFYTEEVRGHQGRLGFDVVTLNGARAPLARKQDPPFTTGRPRIGSYLVDVASFEALALPQLVYGEDTKLIVVDEIGKMEFYSAGFQEAVGKVLDSRCVVFGVIPKVREIQTYSGEHPLQVRGRYLVNSIKKREDVQLVHVSKKNREDLVSSLASQLRQQLSTTQ